MIEVDISKRFGAARAQDDKATLPLIEAKFSSAARVLALFGRSGSGKSTVVNAIAGLVKADRGRVVVDGETLFDSERGINMPIEQRGVGYVFQEGLLFPHLSVRQNLLYGAGRNGVSKGRSVAFDRWCNCLGSMRCWIALRPRYLAAKSNALRLVVRCYRSRDCC